MPHLYAEPALRALLARELTMLAPILGGVYGNRGLFLRPHGAVVESMPEHLLGQMLDLTVVDTGLLHGPLQCAPQLLPLANESFKLVIAQHVLEHVTDVPQCISELARVLAPEGIALILGFNRTSLWRPWLAMHARRRNMRLQASTVGSLQRALMFEQVETLQVRHPGLWWPHAAASNADSSSKSPHMPQLLGRFTSSWLLLARKRRDMLTPLRLQSQSRDLRIKPYMAPGAQRARAR